MRSETIDFVAAGNLITTSSPKGAQVLVRVVHNSCFPQPGRGCSLSQGHARFPVRSVSLDGAGVGKILNVRHAVVPSSDRIRDEIGLQNGCFPTARLAPPRAAKFPWFVAACLHQYSERNDVGFVRRPLLDWSSDDLNFVL